VKAGAILRRADLYGHTIPLTLQLNCNTRVRFVESVRRKLAVACPVPPVATETSHAIDNFPLTLRKAAFADYILANRFSRGGVVPSPTGKAVWGTVRVICRSGFSSACRRSRSVNIRRR